MTHRHSPCPESLTVSTGRRHFIKAAGATLLAATGILPKKSAFSKENDSQNTLIPLPNMVVDTHTHFYDPSRPGGVPWPQPNSPLYRTVIPDDWRKVAAPCGVTHTVIVEASKLVEDNAWILELASQDKAIVGIVGNLNPMEPDFSAHLDRFAANPLFRGIRVSGKNFTDHADKPEFISGIKKLSGLGLSLDVNGPHPTLETAARLARTIPDLTIVVDHIGNAGDPAEVKDEWKQGMKAVGSCPNVYCKVSGVPEQSKAEWGKAKSDLDYYRPLLDWVWNCFGEDRLIYGSNWPVSDKGTSYENLFNLVHEYFSHRGKDSVRKYFLENSQKAYKWVIR